MRELSELEITGTLNYVLKELQQCCPSVFQRVVDGELPLHKAIREAFLSINPSDWEEGAPVHGPISIPGKSK